VTAKNDVQRGLRAKVYADNETVKKAIVNAADLLGKRASALLGGSDQVTVKVQTTTVGVTHRPKDDGSVEVLARVGQYRTSQEKLFYFIPVGPKLLRNKRSLITFLEALQQELDHIKGAQGSVQLTGPGSY
jgi:hypothetical protein